MHKESCDGHLRKVGMAYLDKARGVHREHNWSQLLRYCDLAATKLKQMKDRPVEAISHALSWKCSALDYLGQYREQLECAKEWYCLWNTKPTDVGAIVAAFALIQSCLTNKEYADAHLYASTLYEIINHKHDNRIPVNQRQRFIANGAYFLASATLALAKNEGIPPEENQKGQEAIAHARRALEIHTQLHGTEHDLANVLLVLADALDYFNDGGDDEEVLRLVERAKSIYARMQGGSTVNVAICEEKLARAYDKRVVRACAANDRDGEQANLELAVPRYREAARIYRANNRIDIADVNARNVVIIEEELRQLTTARATAAATKG